MDAPIRQDDNQVAALVIADVVLLRDDGRELGGHARQIDPRVDGSANRSHRSTGWQFDELRSREVQRPALNRPVVHSGSAGSTPIAVPNRRCCRFPTHPPPCHPRFRQRHHAAYCASPQPPFPGSGWPHTTMKERIAVTS